MTDDDVLGKLLPPEFREGKAVKVPISSDVLEVQLTDVARVHGRNSAFESRESRKGMIFVLAGE